MGPVDTLAVVGPGLIGTSVVLAAKRKWPSILTRTIDRSERLDPISKADLVVLATPVGVTIELLPALKQLLDPAALVIDTGSTKRMILQAAKAAGVTAFVGGHPMAGGATPGPSEARANLFDNMPWFMMNPDAHRRGDGSRDSIRRRPRRALRPPERSGRIARSHHGGDQPLASDYGERIDDGRGRRGQEERS